jgi:hypothetical protein
MLVAATSSPGSRPVQVTPEIVGYDVQPGPTWTDPETNLTYQNYTFSIEFTHNRGPIGVQVNEYAAANDGLLDRDGGTINARTIGTDTINYVQVVKGLAGQTVYFKLFLFKPEVWFGKPGTRGEVIYDTETTPTYNW